MKVIFIEGVYYRLNLEKLDKIRIWMMRVFFNVFDFILGVLLEIKKI